MSDLVNRLRGIYTTPITDGCGPIDGKMEVTRKFDNLPPIMAEAANEIERLNKWAESFSDAQLKERAASEAHIKAAYALLRQYGRHEGTCAALLFTSKPCNCGWDGAVKVFKRDVSVEGKV